MKNSFTILSAICVFLLTACQTQSTTITDVSPNKKVNITIKANRTASLDPWKVEMDVKAYDFKEGHLAFEIQTGEVTDKTVKFDWKDDRNCIISMNQADGKPRTFQLIADANQVQLGEVNL